jgi:hypothetical protein
MKMIFIVVGIILLSVVGALGIWAVIYQNNLVFYANYNTNLDEPYEVHPLSLIYVKDSSIDKKMLFNKGFMSHPIQEENLKLLKSILDKHRIRYYIDCGTLLGAIRENRFIDGDEDADIMVSEDGIKELRKALPELETLGFISFRNSGPYMAMSLIRKGEYIDIYHLWPRISFELIPYPFLGTEFPVPKDYDAYLTELYGQWKIPDPKGKGSGTNWEDGMQSYVRNHSTFSIIDDVIHFRYKPRRYKKWLKSQDSVDTGVCMKKEPPIFDIFEYTIHGKEVYNKISGNPKIAEIVYCWPERALTYRFNEFPTLATGEKRVLVAMGEDTHSSRLSSKAKNRLLDKFSTVFWEANTDPAFKTLPMGLISCYVSLNGAERVEDAIKRASIPGDRRLCCIPLWNKFSTELVRPDRAIASRTRLSKFTENNDASWFDVKNWSPREYYEGVSQYKFATCPTGNGIQAPKIFEAIMVRTIPIVEYELAFAQLKELGIPLLIIDNWDDLSPEFLEQKYIDMDVDWNAALYLCSTPGVAHLIRQHL